MFDERAHLAHRLFERGFNRVETDPLDTVSPARRIIRHDVDGGERKAHFTGQCRFRHSGHAHDIGTIAFKANDLGSRLKARPLGRRVNR